MRLKISGKTYILLYILYNKFIVINIITFKNDFPNFWVQGYYN